MQQEKCQIDLLATGISGDNCEKGMIIPHHISIQRSTLPSIHSCFYSISLMERDGFPTFAIYYLSLIRPNPNCLSEALKSTPYLWNPPSEIFYDFINCIAMDYVFPYCIILHVLTLKSTCYIFYADS